VLAAPGAAGVLFHGRVAEREAAAFVAFCLIASATYLLNDLHDRDEDREHPTKRLRPVAAGELSVRLAVAAAAVLGAAGLLLAGLVGLRLLAVAVAYVLLTASYTLLWRRRAYVDVLAVAGCFALRAVAGGAAAPVHLSRYFLLVCGAGALLVVSGKRLAELRRSAARPGAPARSSLRGYSERGLMLLGGGALLALLAGYGMWAGHRPEPAGTPWNELSVIPFVAWLGRYAWLVRAGHGEAPEELVLGDGPLLACSLLWLVVFGLGVHATH
jgi:decaprenyl-phosphate phosphoribosyltransferase